MAEQREANSSAAVAPEGTEVANAAATEEGATATKTDQGQGEPNAPLRKSPSISGGGGEGSDNDWCDEMDDDLAAKEDPAPTAEAEPAAPPVRESGLTALGSGGGSGSHLRSGGRGRGTKASSIEPGPPVPPGPAATIMCNICHEEKDPVSFEKKGKQCKECGALVESFQRQLRKVWKSSYRARYRELSKDREQWRRDLMDYKVRNAGRTKRKLEADTHTLAQDITHGTRKIRRRPHRAMTYAAFASHFAKDEHGGYDEAGILAHWRKLTAGQEPKDYNGVVRGTPGHKRYRIVSASVCERTFRIIMRLRLQIRSRIRLD